jgi:hypothetical protein
MFIKIILFTGCAIITVICFIYTLHHSSKIWAGEYASQRKRIIVSLLTGVSFSLLFVSLVLFGGDFEWIKKKRFLLTVTTLLIGLVITIGAYWRFFIIGKYRNYIYRKYGQKHRDDRSSDED